MGYSSKKKSSEYLQNFTKNLDNRRIQCVTREKLLRYTKTKLSKEIQTDLDKPITAKQID